jgi:hypothetical protein
MGFGFYYYEILREGEASDLKRRHEHARALNEGASLKPRQRRRNAIKDRITSLRGRRRPQIDLPLSLTAEGHELTQAACRLADGSMGRIAIVRQSAEEWAAVCVQT